jgi:hypothetical protein
MEVTASDKHSILLPYRINYSRKMFYNKWSIVASRRIGGPRVGSVAGIINILQL